MTITSTSRVAGPFSGTGSTASFPFTFKVFQQSDLYVALLDLTGGAITVLALTTDYTVALNSDQDTNPGGSVTLTTGGQAGGVLATGFTLTITSSMAALQGVDLSNGGAFYPDVINQALDTLTILIQQQNDTLQRTIVFPLTDGNPPAFSTTLPSAPARAGLMLGFDSSGDLATYNSVPEPGPQGSQGPQGTPGPANTLGIGTVATGAAGSSAAATITGASPTQTLNLTIPQGIQGIQGIQGAQGVQGVVGPSGASLNYRGAWSSSTTYALNDAVSVSSVLYASIQGSNLNQNPSTATTYWAIFPAPTLSTSIPPIASGSGSSGSAATAAKGDHVHPTEVTGVAIAPASIAATGNIASAGVITDMEIVTLRQPNRLNLGWAVQDVNGNVALGVTNTGAVIGVNQLPTGATISGSDLTLPGNLFLPNGLLSDGEIVSISPYNYLGLVWAFIDSTYQVAWGITKAGTLYIPAPSSSAAITASAAAPLNQTGNPLAPNVDSLSFYYAPDGSAVQQVSRVAEVTASTFAVATGAAVSSSRAAIPMTTDSSNHNTQPSPNQDASWITYLKTPTAGGAPTIMKMNRWGQHKIPMTTGYEKLFALSHVLIGGQSLADGAASTAISLAQPFSNVMFNAGVRPGGNAGPTVPAMPAPTSIVPLVEQTDATNAYGETIASGFANTVYQWMAEAGILMPLLLSDWGVGGFAYASLAKGTQPYANGQAQVSGGLSLFSAAGYASYGVRSLLWVHGEADAFTAAYDANLATMQANFEADTLALTGQPTNIPMFLCQTSGLCSYPVANGLLPTTILSPYLQLQAAINNPGKIVLTGPSYMCQYNTGPSPHMIAQGYRKQGGYFAKAFLKQVFQNEAWRPLSPRKIVRDGLNIYVDFWVPVPPIRINVADVIQPTWAGSKYGFEYFDSSATPPAISAVNVIGPTTLQIVLASVPTGSNKQLRYAYTFTQNTQPGPTTGQRGNLCDSDTATSWYGDALPNWCVHFNQAIN